QVKASASSVRRARTGRRGGMEVSPLLLMMPAVDFSALPRRSEPDSWAPWINQAGSPRERPARKNPFASASEQVLHTACRSRHEPENLPPWWLAFKGLRNIISIGGRFAILAGWPTPTSCAPRHSSS
ncbi:MAG TPA: hypothetical protein VFE79_21155, partial [Paraburkholderia sp.]|nr:hypothetical protein [Paraburkholderia sp.]